MPGQHRVVAVQLLTPRLRLRRWRPADGEELAAVFAKPEVWRFPLGRGLRAEETAAFLARRLEEQHRSPVHLWAAELLHPARLIGYMGLAVPTFLPEILPAVEIGWRLDPDWWGRGLATEGGAAVLAHAFGPLHLDEVVSIYQPENAASGAVMRRLGMRAERDTRHPALGTALRDMHRSPLRSPADGSRL